MSQNTMIANVLSRFRKRDTAPADRSPRRLVVTGMVGILLLATLFMTGTFTAIGYIDARSVEAELQRAHIAIEATTDPLRLTSEFGFLSAHVVAPDTLARGEISLAIPGQTAVLAWTPRRFATDAFLAVAPGRLLLATLIVGTIVFIMLRLNALARDLESRRSAAHEMATRDPLTGLRNRLTFDQELREAIASSRGAELALLYLDLDGFKTVNDTRGHPAGDALLRQVAERLIVAAGPGDTVARLGGDEFAVIRRSGLMLDELASLAGSIAVALGSPFILADGIVTVGVSIGIARVPADADNAEDVVRAADGALYRAKAAGGRRYAFAGEPRPRQKDRRQAA